MRFTDPAKNLAQLGLTLVFLLDEARAWPIMFERDQNERHVLKSAHLNMPHRFRRLRYAVGQIQAELVAGNNQHRKVYRALQELVPQVNKVHGYEVASARDLKFNANADVVGAPIDSLPLDPVDSA